MKIKELTVEQLNALINEAVEDRLAEYIDPDKGCAVKPEVLEELRKSLAEVKRGKRGIPLEQLAREMGFDLE